MNRASGYYLTTWPLKSPFGPAKQARELFDQLLRHHWSSFFSISPASYTSSLTPDLMPCILFHLGASLSPSLLRSYTFHLASILRCFPNSTFSYNPWLSNQNCFHVISHTVRLFMNIYASTSILFSFFYFFSTNLHSIWILVRNF